VKPRVLYLAAGLFVLVLVLWRWVGPASLVLLALGLLGWLLWGQPRTGKGNQAKHAAKSPGSGLENKDLSTDSKSDSKTPPPDPPAKSKR
jgi:chromate transport protein ChrA